MKHYYHHGADDFVIACGYMGDFIKSWFLDQHQINGNLSIDFRLGEINRTETISEYWIVNLVDTGPTTNTGGRLLRLKPWLAAETFMLTYGDGVSNVDIAELLEFHRLHGKITTVTAVRPPARFGGLMLDGASVAQFTEKPMAGEGWTNGGFMVFEPEIFDYLEGDSNSLETDALERLAAIGQLVSPRSCIVAMDGIMQDIVGAPRTESDWDVNNPQTAIRAFLHDHPDFEMEEPAFPFNEGMISERYTTYCPRCFLRRRL